MWNYMCIRWLINWSDSTKMHGATIRFTIRFICTKVFTNFLRSYRPTQQNRKPGISVRQFQDAVSLLQERSDMKTSYKVSTSRYTTQQQLSHKLKRWCLQNDSQPLHRRLSLRKVGREVNGGVTHLSRTVFGSRFFVTINPFNCLRHIAEYN